MKNLHLSVVVPVFNESEVLPLFLPNLKAVLDGMKIGYEVIFVDDGSRDDSSRIISDFGWKQSRVLKFVANAGHQAALQAGYKAAIGEWAVTLDADLQHPPQLIPELLATAKETSSDVVYGVRKDRSDDSWWKRTTARQYYKLARWLSGVDLTSSAADFRLVSRRVLNVINAIPDANLVFRLLIPSLGFPSAEVAFRASPRPAGKSKYTFYRMASLSVESIVGFSTKPLTLAINLGIFTTFLAFIGFIYAALTFYAGQSQTGWASLISTVLLLFGVLFVILGVHGLYIGAILKNTMFRPVYILENPSRNERSN